MRIQTRKLTVIGVLSAISIVLGLTPLGFIPIPPANATTMHIPVIIGAILEGPVAGALIGLIFGLFSMLQAIMRPGVLSFAFLNPIVAVLPRIMIGLISYYVYAGVLWLMRNSEKKHYVTTIASAVAAAAGTLTNTIGVLGMIYIIYAAKTAEALGVSYAAAGGAIAAIGMTNGIPEIIIAVIITVAVVSAVRKIRKR